MRYYLIAGEASGDLHASRLMRALKEEDREADFRFFGGDLMDSEGGTRVKHYRELAYMGFIPVLLHLPTILRNMKRCKQDICEWKPDVVILVDYPGFNLSIAKYVHSLREKADGWQPRVYYYIAPKIWAWKEYRIKNIRRDVDELFSILPFEVDFFEGKHQYPIHYVGNPTKDEVDEYLQSLLGRRTLARQETSNLQPPTSNQKPLIALLAGSRRQEIKDNLPAMLEVAKSFPDYRFVVAGAPSIDDDYYAQFLSGTSVEIVKNKTYELLSQAHAALVTSGTATLETALFGVPQVVCYETPLHKLVAWLRKHLLKVKYVSLVNLVANREVVRELVADSFTIDNIKAELTKILGGPEREAMLKGYAEVRQRLGDKRAPEEAARIMCDKLRD